MAGVGGGGGVGVGGVADADAGTGRWLPDDLETTETLAELAARKLDQWRVAVGQQTEAGLDRMLEQTRTMLREAERLGRETGVLRRRMRDSELFMRWTEERLEWVRRERNERAVILWNFPEDLHPQLVQSAPQQLKMQAFRDFLQQTVGVPEQQLRLVQVEHIRVFYTVYKSKKSANVRLQFVDQTAKALCEAYCCSFLKQFNPTRPLPTRWKDDQTELQRQEATQPPSRFQPLLNEFVH